MRYTPKYPITQETLKTIHNDHCPKCHNSPFDKDKCLGCGIHHLLVISHKWDGA